MIQNRFFRFVALAVVLGSAVMPSSRAQLQSAASASGTPQKEENRILFGVIDKDSHFFSTLQAEDVRVLVNDKPQEMLSFHRLENQTLSLAILIDTSASQEKTLPQQKLAADSFLQTIMRPAKDQVAVVTFTGKPTVEQPFTNDNSLVRQAISRARFVAPPGYRGGGVIVSRAPPISSPDQQIAGSTAIWDAVWATCDQLMTAAAPDTRKAIVLLTDGEDTSSNRKMHDVIQNAFAANVAVYAIGIGDKNSFGINESALRKVSEQTGGLAFFPKKGEDLKAVFAEIEQGLRFQYQITYRALAGKADSHPKVRIEFVNPDLRARKLRVSYQGLNLAAGN